MEIVWLNSIQLLDVLNAHFQDVFKINKTQSTLLQFAYFGAYLFFAPIASVFVRRRFVTCASLLIHSTFIKNRWIDLVTR
jgi:fucose permease